MWPIIVAFVSFGQLICLPQLGVIRINRSDGISTWRLQETGWDRLGTSVSLLFDLVPRFGSSPFSGQGARTTWFAGRTLALRGERGILEWRCTRLDGHSWTDMLLGCRNGSWRLARPWRCCWRIRTSKHSLCAVMPFALACRVAQNSPSGGMRKPFSRTSCVNLFLCYISPFD